jgi:hypothetical protein
VEVVVQVDLEVVVVQVVIEPILDYLSLPDLLLLSQLVQAV